MKKVDIQFKGMSNTPDDMVARDGQMAIMMNARYENGEMVPIDMPQEAFEGNGKTKQVMFHTNSKQWLFLMDDGRLVAYKEDFGNKDNPTEIKGGGVMSFALLGNIVVMNMEDDVEYAIWKEGRFLFLGRLPEVPVLNITQESVVMEVSAGDKYYSYWPYNSNKDIKWPLFSKGYFDECLNKCYEEKFYIDNVLFIVGLKLFDGSYKYSHLYLLNKDFLGVLPGNFVTTAQKRPENTDATLAKMVVSVNGWKVGFKMDYDLSLWKDVVQSVDIFTSGSILNYEASMEKNYVYGWNSNNETGISVTEIDPSIVYTQKSMPLIREEIENCSTFYKIESYDLKGVFIKGVDNTSPSNLAQQDRLPYDNANKYIGRKNFVYNNRLHVYEGDSVPVLAGNDVYTNTMFKNKEKITKKTSIKIGEKVIQKEIEIPKNNNYFTTILSHPTTGVEKQIIDGCYEIDFKDNHLLDMSVAIGGRDKSNYYVTFKCVSICGALFEDLNNGTSYYLSLDRDKFLKKINYKEGDYVLYPAYNNRDFVVINNSVKEESLEDYGIYGQGENFSLYYGQHIYISVKKKDAYYDISSFETNENAVISEAVKRKTKSTLQVSAIDNPFYFPPGQTYNFEGDVVALAANTEAISQGQFGQYPLFVFTTEGIWAMQVDTSGKGAYSSQAPFSREVCTGVVAPFSGGVAFATQKGLMAISQGQVVELSEMMDGRTPTLERSNALITKIFQKVYPEMTVFDVLNLIKPEPIRTYIKDAVMGYNYDKEELVISNKGKKYSYVYNLKDKTWGMIGTVFDLTTNSYPELVVVDSSKGKVIRFENGNGKMPIVAITRPIKAETFDFKRLRQAALRTTFIGSLNFYILGSNDGAKFEVITGKEYPSVNGNEATGVKRRDLITAMSRSRQYKYFAIAIAGDMTGSVSFAELLIDEGFANNKLR